jgi:hypothetical protein
MSSPHPAATTKAAFLTEGFTLTILDTTGLQEDCGICTKPIYKAKCDSDAKSHNHGNHCSLEQKDTHAAAPLDEYPEPGIKIKACGDVMGHQCALTWFEHKSTCPFCRAKLFVSREEEEEEEYVRLLEELALEGRGKRIVTWF